jgi:hypothetical protein
LSYTMIDLRGKVNLQSRDIAVSDDSTTPRKVLRRAKVAWHSSRLGLLNIRM